MPHIPTSEEIRAALHHSVDQTLQLDWDLIALGAHEQSIAHRIAVYLESWFRGFHVDCEYNRSKHGAKAYQGDWGQTQKSMRPDIIVHRRNTDINVMAIEMKANDNSETPSDRRKLKELTAKQGGYQYSEAAFIEVKNSLDELRNGELHIIVHWYGFENNDLVGRGSCPFANRSKVGEVQRFASLRMNKSG